MDEYDRIYHKDLKISAAAHLAALVAALCVNFLQGCISKPKPPSPETIEFTVAIPQDEPAPPEPEPAQPEPALEEPPPIPEPEPAAVFEPPEPEPPEKAEPSKPVPPKKPEKPKINVSRTVVNVKPPPPHPKPAPAVPRAAPRPAAPSKLTPDEVRKLLESGAKPGVETVVPDEAARGLLRIKEALYAAWRVPPPEHGAGRGAEVVLRIGESGVILDKRLARSSGDAVFDQSALDAVAAAGRVNGLSRAFIRAYPDGVAVLFEIARP